MRLATPQRSAGNAGGSGASGQQRAVATVYVIAVFVNIIDATVVNVALPTIAAAFRVPVGETATVNVGFLVAVAVAIPAAGWLGDRYGTREVFVTAVALFTLTSTICGFAGTLEQLVLCRIAQGLAGGLMIPVGMAMLYRTFPPAERIRIGRLINIPIAFAPAMGPVVGGLLVEHAGWRWIFWVNLPVGAVAVTATLLAVRPLPRHRHAPLDVAGLLLFGGGFAGVMYALSVGATRGWTSAAVAVPGLLGLAVLTAAVTVELRTTDPLLRLKLLAVRLFRSSSLITVCSSASFLAALFAFPLMLQSAYGYTPLHAGLLTFPEAAGVLIGTQVAGRNYRAVGPRRLIAAGQLTVTVVIVLLALLIRSDTPAVVPVVLMVLLGIGQAYSFLPVQASALDTVPVRDTGQASALFNVTRQAGSALGVAVAATVITGLGAHGQDAAAGPFRWALVACAGWSLAGFLVAMFAVPDEDAAPSRGLTPPPAGPDDGRADPGRSQSSDRPTAGSPGRSAG